MGSRVNDVREGDSSTDVRPASHMPWSTSTLVDVRSLLTLLLAALLLAAPVLAPGAAHAQAPETEEDADAEAIEDGGYEPDQRGTEDAEPGYEPDQRGTQDDAEPEYEPDQRGVEDEPEYEPDQRGSQERERTEAEPMAEETSLAGAADSESIIGGSGTFGFDLQLWLGSGVVGLDAIDGDNLVRRNQRGGPGVSFGFVGALRLGPISVGPRIGVNVGSFVMASFGGDVQAVLTNDRFAPFVRASLSYVFLGDLGDALPSQSETRVEGVLAEIGVGARFRIAGPFVLGAELSGGYLHLERGAAPSCEAPCSDGELDLTTPGTADGLSLRVHLFGGLSF